MRVVIEPEDVGRLEAAGIALREGAEVRFVRFGDGRTALVHSNGGEIELDADQVAAFEAGLPYPFDLPPNVPLPNSISIAEVLRRKRCGRLIGATAPVCDVF